MDRKLSRKLLGSALAVAALVFAGSAAQAGPGNAVTVALTSTVQDACSLATNNTSYSLGDVSATPASNVQVATLTETCNTAGGYTVALSSLNAGSGTTLYLKGTANPTSQIDYSLAYGTSGNTVTYSNGVFVTNANAPTIGANNTSAPVQKGVYISTVSGTYLADAYTDTLTFTLAAK